MVEQRFFFAHVQKAAGTSLFMRLQRNFAPEQIYPDASDVRAHESAAGSPALPRLGPTLLVSHLIERYRVRRAEIRIVTGHFPLRTNELLGDEFTTLTLVRDPVERTLSSLRHHRAKTPADRDRPLEALYEDPIRYHGLLHNHMVKMFSLTPDEIMRGDGVMARVHDFTTKRLDQARARLESVDVLGLHHELEDFCDELTARFGWQLGPTVHANRTQPVDVSASFRARIASDNALDAELYEYAEQLWVSRRRHRRPVARRPTGG